MQLLVLEVTWTAREEADHFTSGYFKMHKKSRVEILSYRWKEISNHGGRSTVCHKTLQVLQDQGCTSGSHGYRLSFFRFLKIELRAFLCWQPWSSGLFLFPPDSVSHSASAFLTPLALEKSCMDWHTFYITLLFPDVPLRDNLITKTASWLPFL